MKEGWEIKKLVDICSIQLGKTPYRKNPKFWDKEKIGGNVWLSISDLKHGEYISESAEHITDLGAKQIVKIPKGTILLSFKLTLGRISFAGTDLYTNEAIAALLNLDKKISKDFLFYYFTLFDWDKAAEGDEKVKGKTLNKQKLKELPVPLPPLPEQQRIVSILDKAFAAIDKAKANAEQNLKNAEELFESYLQGEFFKKGTNWINSTIGETCNLMTGGTPSTNKKEYYGGGNIKWLVSGDIHKKEIFDCEGRITKLGLENSNARYLPINSVLIALNGQGKTRGTVAMLRTNATCNQSLVSIYPKEVSNVLPELIFANLEGRYDEIRKLTGDSGNDRRGLNMPIIRKISFSYPKSVSEQQKLIVHLNTVRAELKKLEFIYQNKISKCEELKKSILRKAFAGELTIKSEN